MAIWGTYPYIGMVSWIVISHLTCPHCVSLYHIPRVNILIWYAYTVLYIVYSIYIYYTSFSSPHPWFPSCSIHFWCVCVLVLRFQHVSAPNSVHYRCLFTVEEGQGHVFRAAKIGSESTPQKKCGFTQGKLTYMGKPQQMIHLLVVDFPCRSCLGNSHEFSGFFIG